MFFLPVARDYKRLYEKNTGPNTGGMGAIAPVSVPVELMRTIAERIVKPTLKGLKDKNMDYFGVLYLGLMVQKNFPKILEYNVRFGDPEAQVLLPLLDGSWKDVFYNVACGELPVLKWKSVYSACVVLCSESYPEGPIKEALIKGSIDYEISESWFLHGSFKAKRESVVYEKRKGFECCGYRANL